MCGTRCSLWLLSVFICSPSTCTRPPTVAVCCCCAVVCGIRCSRRRGKYSGPQRLEDIWGQVEMVGPSMQSTPEEVHANTSCFLGLDGSGEHVHDNWDNLAERGVLDEEEGLMFSNPMFVKVDSQDGGTETWSFGEWVNMAALNEEKEECGSGEEKPESEGRSSEEGQSEGSDTEGDGSESGSGKGSDEGSDKESKLSGEESDEDTSSAEEANLSTALLPPATTSGEEDTSLTAALVPDAASEEDTPPARQPMTQEEMEQALAELQKAEEELGGSLVGWDEVYNFLFNQWQDVQEMDSKGEGDAV